MQILKNASLGGVLPVTGSVFSPMLPLLLDGDLMERRAEGGSGATQAADAITAATRGTSARSGRYA